MSFIHISRSLTGNKCQFEPSSPGKPADKTKAFKVKDDFKLAASDPARKSREDLKKIEKPAKDEDSLAFLDKHFG